MATSQFFNNYLSVAEQNLLDDLVNESIKVNGIDWFQFLSFATIHGLWYDFYCGYLKKRIYGLK